MLFPQDKPTVATGPGALIWPASPGCAGGAGARVQSVLPGLAPGPAIAPRAANGTALDPNGALGAASSPHGQIAIAGEDPRHPGRELVVQGRAGGAFKALLSGAALAPPNALATAYLGDLALAAPVHGKMTGALELGVRIERWFAASFGPALTTGGPARGAVSSLAVAMDFRSDALLAWAQGGSVWVRDLPARGAPRAPQRLGPAGSPAPHIAALLSDDNRGIVSWTQRGGAGSTVWLDYSATGPSFGAPQALERIPGSPGPAPPASPLLIRLSSESVMIAWAGRKRGAGSCAPRRSTNMACRPSRRSARPPGTRCSTRSLRVRGARRSP